MAYYLSHKLVLTRTLLSLFLKWTRFLVFLYLLTALPLPTLRAPRHLSFDDRIVNINLARLMQIPVFFKKKKFRPNSCDSTGLPPPLSIAASPKLPSIHFAGAGKCRTGSWTSSYRGRLNFADCQAPQSHLPR